MAAYREVCPRRTDVIGSAQRGNFRVPKGAASSDLLLPPTLPPDEGGFGGGGGPNDWGASRRASFAGLAALLAATGMVFFAFTGAYLMRRGYGQDWRSTPLPPLVWINSAVILASSAALEVARIALKTGRRQSFNGWWTAGTLLGIGFLLGQAWVWRQMHAAGIYVSTNPSSSFFFLLTGAHAVHLLTAAVALVWVEVCALRFALGPARRTGAEITALFWHFLAGIWIYLLLLFSWLG